MTAHHMYSTTLKLTRYGYSWVSSGYLKQEYGKRARNGRMMAFGTITTQTIKRKMNGVEFSAPFLFV